MKTFLIAAGLLMTAASVYGVVDYSKKAGTKEFKEMYHQPSTPVETEVVEEVQMPIIETKATEQTDAVIKSETTPVKSTAKKNPKKKKEREFELKKFSRERLD